MKRKRLLTIIIIASCGILLILTGFLSWKLYFEKYKIFKNQEKQILGVAKRYYSLNKQYLPNIGEARDIKLQTLYDGGHISDLYIPKTTKLCNSNSWVRVYHNDKDEYIYTTYLECGKYSSKIDHVGPEITLNGNSKMVIGIGSKYEELGVSKVVDNHDGKIDTKNVVIDSSMVNTSKVGVYDVNYLVFDKAFNKTVVTRKVIVTYNLTNVTRENTDGSNYYKGMNVNNYILFSGMLYRIINANDDGSIRIISDEAITNLRMNHTVYENSNVDTWLNNIYYSSLHNANDYLIDGTYCVGNINSTTDYSSECSTTIKAKVGLLNIGDYSKTFLNGGSYLSEANSFAFGNKIADNYAEAPINSNAGISSKTLAPIRPVLTLRSNLYIISGKGTVNNPYKLDDYDYGKNNQLLNKRITGEYVKYSGLDFRIIGLDSNNNVRLIMASPWKVQPSNRKLELHVDDYNKITTMLNNDYLDYINSSKLVTMDYFMPVNDFGLKYTDFTKEKKTGKVFLPNTYELFAAPGADEENRNSIFLYNDRSLNSDLIFMANGVNGKAFELSKSDFNNYSIRAVITLSGNLKINGGNGTKQNPYLVK